MVLQHPAQNCAQARNADVLSAKPCNQGASPDPESESAAHAPSYTTGSLFFNLFLTF